jgi:hypothetical protein
MIKFTMVGTERTGSYEGVANSRAQVGIRDLGDGTFRVRVEPASGERMALAASFSGWTTGLGGKEFRFSRVVLSNRLKATVKRALEAVVAVDTFIASPGCPEWIVAAARVSESKKEQLEHANLVAAVKALKLPGYNFASRWSLATLRAKVA